MHKAARRSLCHSWLAYPITSNHVRYFVLANDAKVVYGYLGYTTLYF